MNSLEIYLTDYYQTAHQFADTCAITTDELAALVNENLVPKASYTILEGGKLISQAFGELRIQDSKPGQYFHPGNAVWVARALEAKGKLGAEKAHLELKKRFKNNFATALKELDQSTFRLPDSFTDSGEIRAKGLALRTGQAWDAFLAGVFSLCVADPSSERSIARKEILQEALTELSVGGEKTDFSEDSKGDLLKLVEQYAQSAMPFSPPEYPGSSRKRLVEDLKSKLNAS